MTTYEYRVDGKPTRSLTGWSCRGTYVYLDEAKNRIRLEKDMDQSQNEKWDYRIQRREIGEWEMVELNRAR